MSSLTYRWVAHTDTGLRRSNNQDSGYASSRLLVIADGMGGAAAGDLASSETLAVLRELDRPLDDAADGDALSELETAVIRANARLGQLIHDDPAVEGMGTTLDAMLWDGEKLAFAHVGDSRAYRLRDGHLTQISIDHTFVQGLVDEGKISKTEARHHPHRSLLLKAILGRDDFEADFSWLQPVAGDRYLLCSDGLSDMVEDSVIEQHLRADTVDLAAHLLVQAALEGGGHDNVTVVIAEFAEADEPTDGELSCANGQPQLVGAATEQPRPRTGRVTARTAPAPDPEELRYAPRPPAKRRWLRWVISAVIVIGVIAGAGWGAWTWSQQQYYVAPHDGKVAIHRGIDLDLPWPEVNRVFEISDIELDQLPPYQRGRVAKGIEARSRADAEDIVENLATQVRQPAPTVDATETPRASATPEAKRATP